jgi:hypothetical protein
VRSFFCFFSGEQQLSDSLLQFDFWLWIEQVTLISEAEVLRTEGYLLFYERIVESLPKSV